MLDYQINIIKNSYNINVFDHNILLKLNSLGNRFFTILLSFLYGYLLFFYIFNYKQKFLQSMKLSFDNFFFNVFLDLFLIFKALVLVMICFEIFRQNKYNYLLFLQQIILYKRFNDLFNKIKI